MRRQIRMLLVQLIMIQITIKCPILQKWEETKKTNVKRVSQTRLKHYSDYRFEIYFNSFTTFWNWASVFIGHVCTIFIAFDYYFNIRIQFWAHETDQFRQMSLSTLQLQCNLIFSFINNFELISECVFTDFHMMMAILLNCFSTSFTINLFEMCNLIWIHKRHLCH